MIKLLFIGAITIDKIDALKATQKSAVGQKFVDQVDSDVFNEINETLKKEQEEDQIYKTTTTSTVTDKVDANVFEVTDATTGKKLEFDEDGNAIEKVEPQTLEKVQQPV